MANERGTTNQHRKQIEARLELHRRIQQASQDLEGWNVRESHDPLPLDTPADTRTLFNEARELLARLQELADRDVDSAVGS